MSWASTAWDDISNGAKGAVSSVGSNINSLGASAGNFANNLGAFGSQMMNGGQGFFDQSMQHLLGQGTYNAFNPGGIGVHNKGLFKNPWAAGRLALGMFALPGMLGANGVSVAGGAMPTAATMFGLPNANLYSLYRNHINRLNTARDQRAASARSATESQANYGGLGGSVVSSSAGQSANDVMARYAAMKQNATDQYMSEIMNQLSGFMNIGGMMAGGGGGGY